MRTVRIAVSQWAPWIQFDANYSLDSAKGVLIELYSGMKQTKIFDYELQMIKAYGVLGPDKKWTGMVGSALRNETDILGPFLIDEGRGSAVQFLSSLDFSELAMATGLTSAGQNPFVVFRVFSAEVWLLFLSAIIFATTVVFLIQSLLPYPCEKGKIQSFLRYFWLFTMSLFGKDFGAKRSWYLRHIWNSRSFRFIQSVWLMTCIIFVNTYQGNITSNFASNKFKPRYETLEDVMSDSTVEIKTYANSFPLMCLSKLNNTSLRPIWLRVKRYEVSDTIKLLDSVEEGKAILVAEIGLTKFYIGERFRQTGKCGIRSIPLAGFCSTYIALGSRKGQPRKFLKQFNIG
ncbi:probable glutamate receptor [Argiope bruennichi]|uniref:probable glutamate receptor n=1 Tax=Argiope bruennichi TaxID=94029 RepID=UPI00249521BD|nr:probable glutamate receptor [Argiope bruennichi]